MKNLKKIFFWGVLFSSLHDIYLKITKNKGFLNSIQTIKIKLSAHFNYILTNFEKNCEKIKKKYLKGN